MHLVKKVRYVCDEGGGEICWETSHNGFKWCVRTIIFSHPLFFRSKPWIILVKNNFLMKINEPEKNIIE